MTLNEKLNSITASVIVVRCGTRFNSVLLDRVQNTAKNIAYLKDAFGEREFLELITIPEILDRDRPVVLFVDEWRR